MHVPLPDGKDRASSSAVPPLWAIEAERERERNEKRLKATDRRCNLDGLSQSQTTMASKISAAVGVWGVGSGASSPGRSFFSVKVPQ